MEQADGGEEDEEEECRWMVDRTTGMAGRG
jgi:hypothetical protein